VKWPPAWSRASWKSAVKDNRENLRSWQSQQRTGSRIPDEIAGKQSYTSVSEGTAWAREDEESPLLEAVTRERLLKTAGWKGLSGCCGRLWSVKISGSAVITCSSEWRVQVHLSNQYPVYSHTSKHATICWCLATRMQYKNRDIKMANGNVAVSDDTAQSKLSPYGKREQIKFGNVCRSITIILPVVLYG
jgi:hypothetical protein